MVEKTRQQIVNLGVVSLRDILTILFKHKKKMLCSFVSILLITVVMATSSVSLFVARSVVLVKPGRENISYGDILSDARVPTLSQENVVSTEIQIITSNDVIGSVVDSIGPYNLYPALKSSKMKGTAVRDAAVMRFKGNLLASDIKQSNLIEILFRNENPHMAEKGLNTLVERLKDKHVQVYGTPKTMIEEQLKEYKQKVAEEIAKLDAYKKEHNIVSIKDQFWWTYGKRTEFESTLRMEESRLKELQDKASFLKNAKRKVVSDLFTSTTRSRLTDLQNKETELLATYKADSHLVKSIRKQIEVMKGALSKYEEENKESSEWMQIEAEIGPQQIKIKSLRDHLVELDRSLSVLSESERKYLAMEREVESLQKSYDSIIRKYEEMKIAEDMDRRRITNLTVIEQAKLPTKADTVNQRKIFGIGLFLAIAVSIGLAYLAEYLPQTMTTPQTAQRYLRLPVLVTVSRKV